MATRRKRSTNNNRAMKRKVERLERHKIRPVSIIAMISPESFGRQVIEVVLTRTSGEVLRWFYQRSPQSGTLPGRKFNRKTKQFEECRLPRKNGLGEVMTEGYWSDWSRKHSRRKAVVNKVKSVYIVQENVKGGVGKSGPPRHRRGSGGVTGKRFRRSSNSGDHQRGTVHPVDFQGDSRLLGSGGIPAVGANGQTLYVETEIPTGRFVDYEETQKVSHRDMIDRLKGLGLKIITVHKADGSIRETIEL